MYDIPVDLDLGMLQGLKDLLGEKFVELVKTYNSDSMRRIELMRDALQVSDFDTIKHEAHGLKGSSRNVGANSLAALCGDMEIKGKEQDAANMEQLFSAIEQQFAAISAQLRELIA